MKINLNKNDNEKFYNLLKIKDDNIEISNLLLTAFAYTDFIDISEIKNNASECEKESIKKQILNNFEIESKEFREAFNYQVTITKCDPSNYINEYTRLLDKIHCTFGKYSLKKIAYEPYQLFALYEISVVDDYKEISNVGYFDKPFSYLALFEGKNLWMSLNPNEINTMASCIEKAKGRVLVLGLGMGYISYMMSIKKSVTSLTIVERNKENIALFKKHLLPLFKEKAKITIIEDDAINFIKHYNKYDYIFADLWFTPEDGLEYYLKLSEIEKENNIKIDYWLETSLKQMRRRYLLELVKEQLEGSDETWYQSEKDLTDKIFKTLYYQTKNVEINSLQDIKDLLL
ncbi:MAG: hypothetical protein K6E21_03195 [Bacilli bacterium]|nr:hypothetical protein [Bacilli bacterium]